jgi:hypothetical protein
MENTTVNVIRQKFEIFGIIETAIHLMLSRNKEIVGNNSGPLSEGLTKESIL